MYISSGGSNENQESIYICGSIAYADKHHMFQGQNCLRGESL